MKGKIVLHSYPVSKRHISWSITTWEVFGATPFEARVRELEISQPESIGETPHISNINVVWWTMWRKKVVGTLVMRRRERVLRLNECMIFDIASFSSLLKLFQSQKPKKSIEKHSRQQKGSRRKAGTDVPFIQSAIRRQVKRSLSSARVMALTEDWMIGFWARNWWIRWQVSSFLRVILENSCLRLERRNEEETRAHILSKRVSSPTAAIILSMISCGISSM